MKKKIRDLTVNDFVNTCKKHYPKCIDCPIYLLCCDEFIDHPFDGQDIDVEVEVDE